MNKLAIITKNKVISINQLTYKVPQKSHTTKELVGCKVGMSTVTTCPRFQKNLAMPKVVYLAYMIITYSRVDK